MRIIIGLLILAAAVFIGRKLWELLDMGRNPEKYNG